ncbi:MAG TPA: tRNA pseudouridine(55) synthase TruB, partial [Burkholderiaceae bacterium]|nr:tRNA pseudouridine(55) synthase TruB [Burkholderiaceae bacterium]
LDEPHARRFLHGQRLRLVAQCETPDASAAQRVRVYAGPDLIGTGTYDDGLLAPLRLIAQGA